MEGGAKTVEFTGGDSENNLFTLLEVIKQSAPHLHDPELIIHKVFFQAHLPPLLSQLKSTIKANICVHLTYTIYGATIIQQRKTQVVYRINKRFIISESTAQNS